MSKSFAISKDDFYCDKTVPTVECWLHSCDLPELTWARLRVFNDGTADSCFCESCKLLGFENQDYAGYILSEDEYICFKDMDEEDEREYGIQIKAITPPVWHDYSEQKFEYLGTY